MECLGGGGRWRLAPQLVDQPIGGDDLAGTQCEHTQQRAGPTPRQGDTTVALHDLEPPQDAELRDTLPPLLPGVTPDLGGGRDRSTDPLPVSYQPGASYG